jgi:hypothetical protein
MKQSISIVRPSRAPLAIMLLGVLTALLAISVLLLSYQVHTIRTRQDNDTSTIRGLIKDAVTNLYQPAAISPKDTLQYAYEAHVDFPLAPLNNQNFNYIYTSKANGGQQGEHLMLTTDLLLSAGYGQLYGKNPQELFQHVPTFQRCTQEFIVQFDSAKGANDGFTQAGSVKLKDGRTAYFFQNENCSQFYKSVGIDIAADLNRLKAVQSY